MTSRDWLLVFLALPSHDDRSVDADPVRIQKALFLLAMEGNLPPSQRYHFIPYNWGACSFDIYSDLDELVTEGLSERNYGLSQRWPTYSVTRAGSDRVAALRLDADPDALDQLSSIKRRLFSQGFTQMLKEIYHKYPQYAQSSLLRLS